MNIQHLRIAMNMADIPVNEAAVETFLLCYALVKKKGGSGTLKDSCEIRKKVEEKYKGTEIIHPEVVYEKEKLKLEMHHAGIVMQKDSEIRSRKEQIADIQQWAELIVNNPNLRPRIWRALAADIKNRCTD